MKRRSAALFSDAYPDTIALKNHFSRLYPSDSNKHLFAIARNESKRVLKEAKSLFAERI